VLGTLSYSIYLTHVLVLNLETPLQVYFESHAPSREIAMLLSIASVLIGTVALASLTYAFIERPGIRVGTAFLARQRSTLIPAE
jgi:peptidoglycan/LPS O-acetylase OafA/YrhL